jgi:hypothetical protein
LLHHLVLGRNIPLSRVAAYLADLCRAYLLIEFVPLSDPKAGALIRNREQWKPVEEGQRPDKAGWHQDYTIGQFEDRFGEHFTIEKKAAIPDTERVLYLMRKKGGAP